MRVLLRFDKYDVIRETCYKSHFPLYGSTDFTSFRITKISLKFVYYQYLYLYTTLHTTLRFLTSLKIHRYHVVEYTCFNTPNYSMLLDLVYFSALVNQEWSIYIQWLSIRNPFRNQTSKTEEKKPNGDKILACSFMLETFDIHFRFQLTSLWYELLSSPDRDYQNPERNP